MCEHLQSVDVQLQEQNTHYGLDSLAETAIHPLLAQAFSNLAKGVHREFGYPSSPKPRPNEAQRQRCDLVLTPSAGQSLFDPIDEQRQQDRAVGTLFESLSLEHTPAENDILVTDAFWLEVKSVGQFAYVDGVPGVNTRYTRDMLTGPHADVVKLASDPLIHHAAALVIVFAQEQETGTHDITVSAQAMVERDLPISIPLFEVFPIVNHAGNEWCTLGLIPVRL